MEERQSSTQNVLRPGFIEFGYGEPDPALLPVGLVRAAATAALDEYGPGAIAYGDPAGPPALRDLLARRITAREGVPLRASEVLVTGGVSQALDQVLTVLCQPDDVVLVESPTYNLALGIIRDYPVEVRGVALDGGGLDVERLDEELRRLRSAGRRARVLYTIPTFHNPAGVCLAAERRRRLLELAAAHDLVIVEDDVYRELAFDDVAPPSLQSLDPRAPVIRLGSFSKSLAPGLRVGWLTAPAELRERLIVNGMLESGGCVSQYAATVAAQVLAGGAYDDQVAFLRAAYRSRRDALAASLDEAMPAGCSFQAPAGGFFIWLRLPEGLAAAGLLPVAESLGVSFAPGGRFTTDGDDGCIRLAFTLFDEAALAEGARRLAQAITAARRHSA